MEPHDLMEQTGRAQEISAHNEQFGRRAAVIVSIMAALLAIATLSGNRASTEAILDQAKATDTYNEYQANSLKRHANENDARLLTILAADSPKAADAQAQADRLNQAVEQKYRPAQEALLPRAQQLETERDRAEQQHRGFQVAEAAFQLGIVLSSIAIVARAAWFLWVGGALGVFGLFALASAAFFLVQIPL